MYRPICAVLREVSRLVAGSDLRKARESLGVGLNRLAEVIGRNVGHLSRVERGQRPVTPALILQYERALGVEIVAGRGHVPVTEPADSVAVTPRPSGGGRYKPAARNANRTDAKGRKGDVRRRRFMQTLTGIAMSTSPSMIALEAMRQSIAHAIGSDSDRWNELAASYGVAFYTTPTDEMHQRLAIDLGVLGQLMSVEPDDPDLERAAAGLAMIMAITLTFAGGRWTAQRWWATARRAADKSRDLDMQVMTRSQDAVKGLYDGRPLNEVLRLADRTLVLAGHHISPSTAGVLAGRAQALAISGRHAEALAATRAVEVMTERMPRAALKDESMFGWPEHRLRHTQSFVFTEIGETARALKAQDRALELYPDTHTSNRSMVEMHRASCLIREGHIMDGLRHATDVLDTLPSERHDQLIYQMARRALAAVPTHERRRPEVTELRDRVATLPTQ